MALSILWTIVKGLVAYNPSFHAERRLVVVILKDMIYVFFITWERSIAGRTDSTV